MAAYERFGANPSRVTDLDLPIRGFVEKGSPFMYLAAQDKAVSGSSPAVA
jgi:hypothetical protein